MLFNDFPTDDNPIAFVTISHSPLNPRIKYPFVEGAVGASA